MIYSVVTLFAVIAAVSGKVYFKEDFNDAGWEKRWTVSSDWKPKVRSDDIFHLSNGNSH